jgi:hypothetical protein
MQRGDEKKRDHGKPMWDLLPLEQVEHIVDVLTFGAQKYGPHQWRNVDDAEDRYFAALMRHLVAWRSGRTYDEESSLKHLGHAGCCLLFLMWLEDERLKPESNGKNSTVSPLLPDILPDRMSEPDVRQACPPHQMHEPTQVTDISGTYATSDSNAKMSEAVSGQPDTTRAPETAIKRPSRPLEGQFKPVSIDLKDSQNTRSKP